MDFIKEFKSNLTLDGKTFKPYNELSFRLDTEEVQDARAMLKDDEIAKILGKQLLKAVAEANKKQVDEGTVGTKRVAPVAPVAEVSPTIVHPASPMPNVAKFSMITKIARQVEGEYVFVDVVKAHKDAGKLREYLQQNELPRTEMMGETPCVVEYGVLEDVIVDVE